MAIRLIWFKEQIIGLIIQVNTDGEEVRKSPAGGQTLTCSDKCTFKKNLVLHLRANTIYGADEAGGNR